MKYRVNISVIDNLFTKDEERQIENFLSDYADQFGIPHIGTMICLDFLQERLDTFYVIGVTIRMNHQRATVRIDITSERNV